MNNPLNSYEQKNVNWRGTLRHNTRQTYVVIAVYFLIYLSLGLLCDIYVYANFYPDAQPSQLFFALLSGELFPKITLICVGVACVSIWIGFFFYDRIMLSGTEYRHITADNAENLNEKQLLNIVEELRVAAGLNYTPKVYIMSAPYMNAFASGYSEKSAMIAVTEGLLQKLNRDELAAVVAHELSHIRHLDIKLTLTASVLSNIILIVIDLLFYNMIWGDNRRRNQNDNNSGNRNQLFWIIILLRYLMPLITVLLTLFLSRKREYMADAGSVELLRDSKPLASALIKISQDSQEHAEQYTAIYQGTANESVRRASYIFDPTQAGIKPVASLSDIFSTHPSLEKRLAALGFIKR